MVLTKIDKVWTIETTTARTGNHANDTKVYLLTAYLTPDLTAALSLKPQIYKKRRLSKEEQKETALTSLTTQLPLQRQCFMIWKSS